MSISTASSLNSGLTSPLSSMPQSRKQAWIPPAWRFVCVFTWIAAPIPEIPMTDCGVSLPVKIPEQSTSNPAFVRTSEICSAYAVASGSFILAPIHTFPLIRLERHWISCFFCSPEMAREAVRFSRSVTLLPSRVPPISDATAPSTVTRTKAQCAHKLRMARRLAGPWDLRISSHNSRLSRIANATARITAAHAKYDLPFTRRSTMLATILFVCTAATFWTVASGSQ